MNKAADNDPGGQCPLCRSPELTHFYSDQRRHYLLCQCCHLISVPDRFHLVAEDEKAQYDLHQNSPDDSGYRKFLSRLADPLLSRLEPNSVGLDFGSGPGPCLSLMMEEMGHTVSLYDLYYADNAAVFERQYQFITATEVVEHLASPGRELQRLWNLLLPGGYLGLMTKLVESTDKEGRDRFAGWHYKIDPTHISFFSEATFYYLGRQWGSTPQFIGADVIIFQKKQ